MRMETVMLLGMVALYGYFLYLIGKAVIEFIIGCTQS